VTRLSQFKEGEYSLLLILFHARDLRHSPSFRTSRFCYLSAAGVGWDTTRRRVAWKLPRAPTKTRCRPRRVSCLSWALTFGNMPIMLTTEMFDPIMLKIYGMSLTGKLWKLVWVRPNNHCGTTGAAMHPVVGIYLSNKLTMD
jgi:hypothetical protein